MRKHQSTRTPSRILADMVIAVMKVQGKGRQELADAANVHINTVYSDLREPERIPQARLWLYFTVLNIPVDRALECIAESVAKSMVGM